MNIENWDANCQAVFSACKKHLPAGDGLQRISSGLDQEGRDNKKGRDTCFDNYGAAIIKELGKHADDYLRDFLTRPTGHHIPLRWDDADSQLNKVAAVLAGVYCERNPSNKTAQALILRLKKMFAAPQGTHEIEPSWNHGKNDFPNLYLFP